ncbi:flagellin N-terminal helical domain-containing protein [Chromohalobacter israelensis]|uniref:flagellin N-terminal helical domain-containing protein n=1 Tax=Chromohalobacter israelensis TaxID=141390 RepID=UPI000FFED044|nr:flagellin [Chromohalobacter salexigens]RXE46000.1 hypothetical protein B4O83_17000 [Chromohalobacter salexigens]
MAVINSNLLSLTARQHQGRANSELSSTLERLSSGLRINSAADDAAGLAIGNRMEANLNANDAVTKGINDGISLMQTAEGGLDQINDLLQRGRQLAVQAANDTLSSDDRSAIQNEFLQIVEEVDRISVETEIFGKHPLAPGEVTEEISTPSTGEVESLKSLFGTSGTTLTSQPSGVKSVGFIPTGAKNVTITIDGFEGAEDDIQIFTQDGKHVVGTPVTGTDADASWSGNSVLSPEDVETQLFTAENGFLDSAEYQDELIGFTQEGEDFSQEMRIHGTYNGMQFQYTGDGDHYQSDAANNDGNTSGAATVEKLNIDQTTEPLFLAVTGSGIYDITMDWDAMPGDAEAPVSPETSSDTDIVMSANYGEEADKITIEPTPADSQTLGLDDVRLTTSRGAGLALDTFDQAIRKVDGYRSEYGSLTNRFDSAIANLDQQSIDTAAARSRIMDADYAQESSALLKKQVIQQASQSILAQANQVPQNVLSLLPS